MKPKTTPKEDREILIQKKEITLGITADHHTPAISGLSSTRFRSCHLQLHDTRMMACAIELVTKTLVQVRNQRREVQMRSGEG